MESFMQQLGQFLLKRSIFFTASSDFKKAFELNSYDLVNEWRLNRQIGLQYVQKRI